MKAERRRELAHAAYLAYEAALYAEAHRSTWHELGCRNHEAWEAVIDAMEAQVWWRRMLRKLGFQ